MSVPDVALGTVAVDTFSSAVGVVIESANGLVRMQHPNGFSWPAYADNLRAPEPAERQQFEAAERTWSPIVVPASAPQTKGT
ncbi:hypothetical protein [Streptomyces hesseae]|uniref:MbtH-like domain-containing protein n=1 Tax=Streptomyces hesseae TaxID=3075519 RepID=A0ABU2SP62_9ACTN|nr:hypothetical protein [Streptomyces sp. DSM 40473]MDT0450756.1 hypothetical protein [Streptomyces sp. DSM 40473]